MPSLYCQNGDHFWDRPPTRGRAPLHCPKHHPKPLTDELRAKRMRKYICEFDGHEWEAESRRGRPPKFCPYHQIAKLAHTSPGKPVISHSPANSAPEKPKYAAIQDPALRAAIEAAESEQRIVILHCAAGDHDFDWEVKRGRRPRNCQEHAQSGAILRREELTVEQKKKAQNRLQEAIARHSARVESAAVPDKEALQALCAAGGAEKCPNEVFNEWLKANNILLNEVLSLRAQERKLELL